MYELIQYPELVEDSKVLRTQDQTGSRVLEDVLALFKDDEVDPSMVECMGCSDATRAASDDDHLKRRHFSWKCVNGCGVTAIRWDKNPCI